MRTNAYISRSAAKKIALSLLTGVFAVASFATLGEGKLARDKGRKLLSAPSNIKPGSFSLRSGYSFRGNRVITSTNETIINLNTVVSFQQGRTTYVMPLKKKVSLNLGSQNQVKGATVRFNF